MAQTIEGFEIIDPNLLPIKVVIDGTEELIFINPSNKRLERAVLDGFEVRSNKAGDFLIIDDVRYTTTKAVDDRFTTEKGTTIATLDGAGKLTLSQLPDIAITKVIVATETNIADFALNNANYTFEQGDVILIDDGGNVTHYLFIGGDKLDVNEYSQISASQVTIGQVVGLQAALDTKSEGAANGLSLNGLVNELGGTLIKDTTIFTGANDFKVLGAGGIHLGANGGITLETMIGTQIVIEDELIKLVAADIEIPTLAEDLTATKVIVQDGSGNLKQIPKSTLEQDLSDVMYKSVPEQVTGLKTFIRDVIGGGVSNYNNIDGLFGYDYNYGNGIFKNSENHSNSPFRLNKNFSTGAFTKHINSASSLGDTFIVEKDGVGEVFKISNDGKLTLKTVAEDLAVADILGRNGSDEVVKIPASTITDGFLPLVGGTLTGGLQVSDGVKMTSATSLATDLSGDYTLSVGANAGAKAITAKGFIDSTTGFRVGSNEVYHEGNLIKKYGILDYNDTATAITPIAVPSNGTFVFLTNDELGAFTNKLYPPDGVTDVWDATANSFDFSELNLGSKVEYRLDIVVTTTGANQEIEVDIELGIGGFSYDLEVLREQYKTAGTYGITVSNFVYMGDSNTMDNGAKFKVKSDNNATVVVNGWACAVHLY